MDEWKWLGDTIKSLGLRGLVLLFAWGIIRALLEGVIKEHGTLIACLIFLPVALALLCWVAHLESKSKQDKEMRRKARTLAELDDKVMKNRLTTGQIDPEQEDDYVN